MAHARKRGKFRLQGHVIDARTKFIRLPLYAGSQALKLCLLVPRYSALGISSTASFERISPTAASLPNLGIHEE